MVSLPSAPNDGDRADPGGSVPTDVAAREVRWRELQRGLCVGRMDDTHLGVIEHGRRYTFTGPDDVVHPGFVSLEAAQSAATGSMLAAGIIASAVQLLARSW